MGLDYTQGCVNFRDVGAFVNLILEKEVLPEKKLYRGGSIDYIKDLEDIGTPKTIINLRNGSDPDTFSLAYFHFPMANKYEKYDTCQKEVRYWLNEIVQVLENPNLEYPILIHCLSGKDRTGIVVAAILLILGIDKEVIIEEYLLSDGEVSRERIQLAMEGMKNVETYFNRVDIDKVRDNLFG